ncbi:MULTISPECIES: helix-turn-helix domain-containing protein [unclassified Sulfurospirillum]|uniref:winged helix-turn-helix transcriptional regulator n=1 Tax=unclassified Sulfurospirillum TaxID=2618290 RepID=UPI000504E7C5|nr:MULTISPECIES: helix-turn-helix domain-containing protein [unclassified Sulfurospirillum]KFL33575.1 transcriptional regulator [Sulfurospirillum sp. SCADC]
MITINEKEFHCPVELTLSIINDKSKIFIVYILLSGQKRFKEICEAFPQVTQKTVTQKLKELEADHIIERTVFAEVPPRVEYALSPIGLELEKVLNSMYVFGEVYAVKYGGKEDIPCK